MVTLKFKSWENGDKQRIHSSWFIPYNKAKCQANSITIAHQVSKVTDNPALKLKNDASPLQHKHKKMR